MKTSILSATAYLLIFIVALIFTLKCVHYSTRFGRLVAVPNYDDVVYFSSGLDFSKSAHKEGFYGIYDHFNRQGTHAPYSEFLAGIVIFFCGYTPRAIYTSDVWLIFIYLCFVRYFLNRLPPFSQAILLLCFLTFPFATMAVVEFRPDLAWATFLGFCCVYLVTRKDYFEKFTPSFIVAALIILALLTKPSTFPMTLLLPTFAFFGRLTIEFIKGSDSFVSVLPRAFIRGVATFSTIMIVMSYYLYYEGAATWSYFWDNTWGKNAILWKYTGDDMWTFYLWGQGYENNIHISGLIFLITTIILTLVYCRKLTISDLIEIVVCFGLILVAYIINSKAPVKSPFMGGAIYGTGIFLMAHIMGRVLPHAMVFFTDKGISKIYSPIWLNITTLVLFVACAVNYQWPPYSYWPPDRGEFLINIHKAVYNYFSSVSNPESICLSAASPIVGSDLTNWFNDRDENPFINSAALALTEDEAMDKIKSCQYVLAQNAGIRQNTGWLQAEKWQDQIVDYLIKSSNYSLEMTFPDKLGKNLYIFKHRATPSIPLPEFKGNSWTLTGNKLTSSEFPNPILVAPVGGDLSWKIDHTTIDSDKNGVVFMGWCGNTKIGLPATQILIFAGSELQQVIPVNVNRQDVADAFSQPSLLQSGFEFRLPLTLVTGSKPLQFIGVLNGKPAVDQSAFLPLDINALKSSPDFPQTNSKETSKTAHSK